MRDAHINYDAFDNENDAYTFLEKDAQNTYEEEVENSRNSADDIILDIEDGCVELSDIPADRCWTWEVIEV